MDETAEVRWVATGEIDPPDSPMRTDVDRGIDELAGNVRRHGQLSPILVRPKADGRYEIVFGHRRWLAARTAGLTEILCRVRAMSDEEAAKVRLAENEQRRPVQDLDRIRYFRHLRDTYGTTLEELSSETGLAVSWLSDLLHILDLPPHILAKFSGRNHRPFSLRHMAALARLAGSTSFGMAEVLECIVRKISHHRISKEETRRLVDFVRSGDYLRLPDKAKEALLSSQHMTVRHAQLLIDPREALSEEAARAFSQFTNTDRERIAQKVCSDQLSLSEMVAGIENLLAGRAGLPARGQDASQSATGAGQRGEEFERGWNLLGTISSLDVLRQATDSLSGALHALQQMLMQGGNVPTEPFGRLRASLRVLRATLATLPLDTQPNEGPRGALPAPEAPQEGRFGEAQEAVHDSAN